MTIQFSDGEMRMGASFFCLNEIVCIVALYCSLSIYES